MNRSLPDYSNYQASFARPFSQESIRRTNERRYARRRGRMFLISANKLPYINRSGPNETGYVGVFIERSSIQFSPPVVEFSSENRFRSVDANSRGHGDAARSTYDGSPNFPLSGQAFRGVFIRGRARFCGQFTCWCKKFRSKIASRPAERGTLALAEVTRAIPDISMAVRLPEYVILTCQKWNANRDKRGRSR